MTSARNCSSFTLIRRLLTGDMPALANVGIAICDMRDVVAAHVTAMTTPAAAGQRYIIHSRSVFLPDVAALLHREFQPRGFPVPTRRAPKFVIALYALFDAEGRAVLASVDKVAQYDHGKAERELGLQMTPWEDAVRGTAESLIALGVVNVAGAK
jgi:dihydroflavonol-4-reductase